MQTDHVIILGIDPGLAKVGIGIVERLAKGGLRFVEACTIETSPGLSLAERLCEIDRDLSAIIEKFHPNFAVVEKLYFETNRKTAIDVSQARGVLLCRLASGGIPVLEPTPLELKSAITGDGHADKRQMLTMLEHSLKMDLAGYGDDAVDALGCAVFGVCTRIPEPV